MGRDPISIDGLAGVDPRAVPLPHGTIVTTTVARSLEGTTKVVPQGAIGRVTALLDDGRVRVTVIGRGELVYARSEVVPRKEGELRHAVRRAAAEAALAPCAVLRAVVGSRAWGLSDDASDVDRRGVFLFPFPWTARLAAAPDVLVSADGSATHWELERTLRQLLRADPNTLEMPTTCYGRCRARHLAGAARLRAGAPDPARCASRGRATVARRRAGTMGGRRPGGRRCGAH